MASSDLLLLLSLVAGGGAGVIASAAFTWLQAEYPPPDKAAWLSGDAIQRFGWAVLHSPRGKRIAPAALSIGIGAAATGLTAAFTGGDGWTALIGALMAAASAHLKHALGKSGEVAV